MCLFKYCVWLQFQYFDSTSVSILLHCFILLLHYIYLTAVVTLNIYIQNTWNYEILKYDGLLCSKLNNSIKKKLQLVDRTISPLGPFSSCSGAFDRITWSSSAYGVTQLSWNCFLSTLRTFCPRWLKSLSSWGWKEQLTKQSHLHLGPFSRLVHLVAISFTSTSYNIKMLHPPLLRDAL